jgi:hypothetical protein
MTAEEPFDINRLGHIKRGLRYAVEALGQPSFADLVTIVPEIKGTGFLADPENNIVWWENLSEYGVIALIQLMRDGEITARVCSPYVYAFAQHFVHPPNLPIVFSVEEYETKSWLPVLFKAKNPKPWRVDGVH